MSLNLENIEQKIRKIISLMANMLLNRRREAIFYYGCFVIIGTILISYIVRSMKYFIPVCYDGITFPYPD
jgi:hypothetical protein